MKATLLESGRCDACASRGKRPVVAVWIGGDLDAQLCLPCLSAALAARNTLARRLAVHLAALVHGYDIQDINMRAALRDARAAGLLPTPANPKTESTNAVK